VRAGAQIGQRRRGSSWAWTPNQPSRPRSTNPSRRRRCTVRRSATGGAICQGIEQAARRFSARGEAVVERNDDGHSPGGVNADERYRQRITFPIEEPVLTICLGCRPHTPRRSSSPLAPGLRHRGRKVPPLSGGTLLDRGGSIMSVKPPPPLPFLRTKEAARFIGVSCRTLEKHRTYGTGPK
jgi:hypothetical protein